MTVNELEVKSTPEALQEVESCREVALPTWEMEVDLLRSAEGVCLYAELPGIHPESLEVHVEDDVLTLGGRVEEEVPGAECTHQEFGPRHLRRAFRLEEKIDRTKISAQLTHGLLRVELPFKDEVKPRRIKVQLQ